MKYTSMLNLPQLTFVVDAYAEPSLLLAGRRGSAAALMAPSKTHWTSPLYHVRHQPEPAAGSECQLVTETAPQECSA